MSQSFARFVFALTALLFRRVLHLADLADPEGRVYRCGRPLTFAYLTALLADPVPRRPAQLLPAGLRHDHARAAPRAAPGVHLRPVPLSRQGPAGLAHPHPDDPAALRGAIGIKQIFGQYGAVNAFLIQLGLRPEGWTIDWFAAHQFWGIAVVQALSLYPIIYLNAVAALANIDPAMEEAAQNLGCTGFRRFWKITLPLIKPGCSPAGPLCSSGRSPNSARR
jgi:iron(III) transport system permease protein